MLSALGLHILSLTITSDTSLMTLYYNIFNTQSKYCYFYLTLNRLFIASVDQTNNISLHRNIYNAYDIRTKKRKQTNKNRKEREKIHTKLTQKHNKRQKVRQTNKSYTGLNFTKWTSLSFVPFFNN
jgi:hypothetical protein